MRGRTPLRSHLYERDTQHQAHCVKIMYVYLRAVAASSGSEPCERLHPTDTRHPRPVSVLQRLQTPDHTSQRKAHSLPPNEPVGRRAAHGVGVHCLAVNLPFEIS